MLTKPSKGSKNDGYDNEDSDYILYVNDILGSEEAGHKYAHNLVVLKCAITNTWLLEIVILSLTCLVRVHSDRS